MTLVPAAKTDARALPRFMPAQRHDLRYFCTYIQAQQKQMKESPQQERAPRLAHKQ